jgi:hypothetical protein
MILAASGTSSARSPEGTIIAQDSARVLLVGDSLAVGLAPELTKLADSVGLSFQHAATGGTSVVQWDAWIADKLTQYRPNIVLVSLGANDYQRTDPDRVRVAIAGFVGKCHDAGAQICWIRPPTMPFPV